MFVFACTGNIGRSPLAAAVARRRLAEALGISETDLAGNGIEVTSVGTHAPPRFRAARFAIAAGDEVGVDLRSHRSRRMNRKLAETVTRVYCMEQGQVEHLVAKYPVLEGKVEMLRPDGEPVPDPRGKDLDFHREVRERIDEALGRRIPELVALVDDV
ncbi:low molecular weight protein-tyrosine-phosphatase ptp [bacterium BMS3Abin02]|nr:low molecular weight protein-tyrosine-phosphatase ptp [bacterium BMS3Abin02]GBE23333.1 low molecular weight protein-tyrosine-phosphatase ptp [bacterium BMS3Bbin01]